MKKIIYSIVVMTSLQHYLYASEKTWDVETVKKITLSLQNKPEELATFLRIVSGTEKHVLETEPVTTARNSEDSYHDEQVDYAIEKLYSYNKIELKFSDILSGGLTCDPRNVTEIDLSEFVPKGDEEVQRIVSYLSEMQLCNLRVLLLPESPVLSHFIEAIFPTTVSAPKFVSLFRIVARASSEITDANLVTIFNHFSNYPCFVRDDEKISGRFGGVAAFLAIAGGITVPSSSLDYDWSEGRKTALENYDIHYRNGLPSGKGAFIMTLRKW